jgi:hypothetical protein
MTVRVSTAIAPVKNNDAGERDLLVNALRVGSARAKLIANTLDLLQAQIRQRAITPDDALKQARAADVLDWIQFGPGVK